MNEKKTAFPIRQANGLFLSMILLYLGTIVLLSLLRSFGITVSRVFALFLGEALIALPALILVYRNRSNWKSLLPFHKIKISTILLLIVFSYLIMPLAMLANAVSMFFVENEMLSAMRALNGIPPVLIVFVTGIYGPICEEVAFRGLIFGKYKTSGRVLPAVLLSAVLFGLMHLNGNQLGYAAILGFVFALLTEATGSLWAPIIVHMVVNTHNTVMVFVSDRLMKLAGTSDIMSGVTYSRTDIAMMIGILLPFAGFMTVLAAGGYLLIARNEGRLAHVKEIFAKKDCPAQKTRYLTWTLVTAVLICVFIIFVLPLIPMIQIS